MKRWIINSYITGGQRLKLFILAKSKGLEVYNETFMSADVEEFPWIGWDERQIISYGPHGDDSFKEAGYNCITYDQAIKLILDYGKVDNKP